MRNLFKYFFNIITLIIIILVILAIDNSVHHPYHTPKNYIFISIVPLVCLISLIIGFRRNNSQLSFTIIETLLLVRITWLFITNPTLWKSTSLLGHWIILSLIVLTLLIRQIADIIFIRAFITSLFLLGTIQSIVGLFQHFTIREVPEGIIKTVMIGTVGTANGYGSFLAISLIAGLYLLVKYRKKTFVLSTIIPIQILILLSLMLNMSRGAILSLCVCILLITGYILYKKFNINLNLIYLILPGLFLIFIIILYKINPESAKGRIMEWRISLPMFIENPIKGIGYGRYAVEYLNYQGRFFANGKHKQLEYKATNIKQAHNEYIQAFCETGLIGGALFISIWVIAIYNLTKFSFNKNLNIEYITIGLILLVLLIHSLVDTPLHVLPLSVVAYSILGTVPGKKYVFHISGKLKYLIITILIAYTGYSSHKLIYQYPAYKYWQKGVYFANIQRMRLAEYEYRRALKILKDNGELLFHLGSSLVISGDYTRGIYYLNKSRLNFNDRNIYLSLALAYTRLKEYEKAIKYAEVAHNMFPDHLAPYLILGEIYYYTGDYEKSKKSLIKCINRDTYIQSTDITQISMDARNLWERFYNREH